MSESILNDSPELSIIEDETLSSYSLLFDKGKHNFSTSSEISFIKHDLLPSNHNQTFTKELSTTMIDHSPTKFNPFLLLFEKSTVKDLFFLLRKTRFEIL
jgi:hypothetical protein